MILAAWPSSTVKTPWSTISSDAYPLLEVPRLSKPRPKSLKGPLGGSPWMVQVSAAALLCQFGSWPASDGMAWGAWGRALTNDDEFSVNYWSIVATKWLHNTIYRLS